MKVRTILVCALYSIKYGKLRDGSTEKVNITLFKAAKGHFYCFNFFAVFKIHFCSLKQKFLL